MDGLWDVEVLVVGSGRRSDASGGRDADSDAVENRGAILE